MLIAPSSRGQLKALPYRTAKALLIPFALSMCWGTALQAQLGPQTVVRKFCEADAVGARTSIQGWPRIAPMVEWALEPAWDRVVLVTSYAVGSPQAAGNDQLSVEVRFYVTAVVTADKVEETEQIESVTYRVRAQGTSWHIVGPPPPPHVFAQQVDKAAMRASLQNGGVNFVSNSMFVWQMFQSAGWKVMRQSTAEMMSGKAYREVQKAKSGDVVLYLRDGEPYHVGILDDQEQVVSSTLNAGIMRTPGDAFAGEAHFLRLIQPGEEEPTAHPTADNPSSTPTSQPIAKPTATATPKKHATAKRSKAKTLKRAKRRDAKHKSPPSTPRS